MNRNQAAGQAAASQALPRVRRVVAGHDRAGRSRIVSDEQLPMQGPPGIGMGVVGLWGAEGAPSNAETDLPRHVGMPGPGGTAFMIAQYPPEASLDALPEPLRMAAKSSPADHVPGLIKADVGRHYAMHRSETVDYGVVLSGEITMVLDDGEVTLRPGDSYVLRGAAHAWSNRGSEPAVLAVIVVGAQPLSAQPGAS